MISQSRTLNRSRWLVVALLAAASELQAQQPPAKVGPELFLPQPASSCQHFAPEAAFGPRGGALIVWTHFGVAARYLPRGSEIPGPQFQISSTGSSPAVAAAGDRRFWVSWRDSPLGQDQDLFLQQLDPDGLPLTSQVLVSTHPGIVEQTLAAGWQGDVYIAWTEAAKGLWRLKLQRYGQDGLQIGDEVVVDTLDETGSGLGAPQIAVRDSGDLLIAWTRSDSGLEILGRGYTAELAPRGDAVQLADPLDFGWQEADVAPFGDGYLFTWTDSSPERAIFTRFADLAAVPSGPTHRIDDAAGGIPQLGSPRLSTYRGSQPLVAWIQDTDDPLSANAWGRLLDENGAPIGLELLLNEPVVETFGSSLFQVIDLEVAEGPFGQLLALWQIFYYPGIDPPDPCSAGFTVMAQQFRRSPSR